MKRKICLIAGIALSLMGGVVSIPALTATDVYAAEADDGEEDELELLLTKKVIADHSKVAEPAVNFLYTVKSDSTAGTAKVGNIPVTPGPLSVFGITNSTEHSFEVLFGDTAAQTDSIKHPHLLSSHVKPALTEGGFEYSRTVTLPIESSAVEQLDPGIYRYTVEEEQKSAIYSADGLPEEYIYDGITYDSTKFTVDLYVFRKGEGEPKFVTYEQGTANIPTDKEEKKTLTFVSDYRVDQNDSTKGTHSVTITNDVTGNMSDPDREFTFTLFPKSSTNTTGSETYYLEVKNESQKVGLDASDKNGTVSPVNDGTGKLYKCTALSRLSVTLKDGEFIIVYGLSPMDSVQVVEPYITVSETNDIRVFTTGDGYRVTVNGTQPQFQASLKGLGSSVGIVNTGDTAIIDRDMTIGWVHDRNITGPTGLLIDYAPFMVVTALAGVAVVLISRRNKSAE